MTNIDRWLLPDGVADILPPAAEQLERLRRRLLDLFQSRAYRLVLPPELEFVESLLGGCGADLDLQTNKVIDQLSGRMLGLRADLTPQVSRIDAHAWQQEQVQRLCYCGAVFHTKPDGLAASRNPIIIGAELYGHGSVASDVEIIGLMVASLTEAGLEQVVIELGHVGIFRLLVEEVGLNQEQCNDLFAAVQNKASAEISRLLQSYQLPSEIADMLSGLADLYGDTSVLAAAQALLKNAGAPVKQALADLVALTQRVSQLFPSVKLHINLCELSSYDFHSGLVYSAYISGLGRAVAKGGRYDKLASSFGRDRAATGFSADLKILADLISPHHSSLVFVADDVKDDSGDDQVKVAEVARLRKGQAVLQGLPNEAAPSNAQQQLLWSKDKGWFVQSLTH